MKQEFYAGAIKAHNTAGEIMLQLQPKIVKIMKSAKRTATGKLFQKDKDIIRDICKQYEQVKIDIAFFEELSDYAPPRYSLEIRYIYPHGYYSDNSVKMKTDKLYFSWWYNTDEDRKFSFTELPDESVILEQQKRHAALRKQMDDLRSEINAIQRDFGISEYSEFIGK
jgi:hypothetical protein